MEESVLVVYVNVHAVVQIADLSVVLGNTNLNNSLIIYENNVE